MTLEGLFPSPRFRLAVVGSHVQGHLNLFLHGGQVFAAITRNDFDAHVGDSLLSLLDLGIPVHLALFTEMGWVHFCLVCKEGSPTLLVAALALGLAAVALEGGVGRHCRVVCRVQGPAHDARQGAQVVHVLLWARSVFPFLPVGFFLLRRCWTKHAASLGVFIQS